MSDIVIVSIVVAVSGLITTVFTILGNIRIAKLAKQMDGVRTEMQVLTADKNKLVGNKEGREELKQELKDDKAESPTNVKIVAQDKIIDVKIEKPKT